MTETVPALRELLDGRWGWVRELAREELRRDLFAPTHGLSTRAHRQRVWEQLQALAETRGPRLGFPAEYGGGDDVGGAVTAFEQLGFGDLSLLVKAGVQWGLFGGAVLHLGTRRHHERHLADVMSVELPGCFAMTEIDHGSDVQSLRTTAVFDPDTDEFVVDTPDRGAMKNWIGNAALHGRLAAVFAQLEVAGESHGVHCLLVPIRDGDGGPAAGVTIEDCGHKAGLNGVDNGRVAFDRVRVPREALLDRYGAVDADGTYTSPIEGETKRFFTMLGTLVQGRISVSGAAVSATKKALTIAVRHGLNHRQFGPPDEDAGEVPLLDYRVHQRRLLPRLARTYALHFAQAELVGELDAVFGGGEASERRRRQLETRAAGIKALSTWHATDTIGACREACGGAGYASENQLPRLMADAEVFTTFEGDNTVLLQLVAKSLLTDYREEFQSLDALGTARFVTELAVDRVVEFTAARKLVQRLIDAAPGRDEDADLRDRGYHLELLTWREQHVLDGVVRRLRRGVEAGDELFEVFNRCQDHVLLAARVHVERIVLEAFVAAIDRCDDAGLGDLLDTVCDLHALALIERDRAWFLEHGRLSTERAKAVIRTVNGLCGQLRPRARELTDAFGIPAEQLTAPIAHGRRPGA